MGLDGRPQPRNRRRGDRGEVFAREDATASPLPDLAHRRYGHLDLIDIIAYREGEFVGFHTGVPYDWNTLDGELMDR
jgi:hypothetical protein